MKILFLDIDGVLNSDEYFESKVYRDIVTKVNNDGIPYHQTSQIDKSKINLLNKLLRSNPDLKIVISSTWKRHERFEETKNNLIACGFEFPDAIIDATPDLNYREYCRGDEIEQWIVNHHEIKSYCIIDDDDDMLNSQLDNFVMIDNKFGLTEWDCEKIEQILYGEYVKMNIELLHITPNAELFIEAGGRICTASQLNEATRNKFIKARIEQGHESILEHAVACFRIEGVTRALTHQLVRHRLISPSQESQRYVPVKDLKVVIPPAIQSNPEALKIYQNTNKRIAHSYHQLVELGIREEDARFLLPNATETKIMVTANFREWRHIIKLRTEQHAQWEIRGVVNEIRSILLCKCPACFEDL